MPSLHTLYSAVMVMVMVVMVVMVKPNLVG